MFEIKSRSEQYHQRMSEVEELMDDLEHGEISILREMKKKELQKMDSVFHNPNWVKVRNYDERIKVLNQIYEALNEYRDYLHTYTDSNNPLA
jgi:hypothetical protein